MGGVSVFSVRVEEDLSRVASRVVSKAAREGVRLVTAESVTGGMVGSFLTGVSGASGVYGGGIVSYGEGAKVGLLGVSREALAREGAVSAFVARAMVGGVLSHGEGEAVWGSGRLLGVATTGYAGRGEGEQQDGRREDGRQDERLQEEGEKIGLVFVAVGFAEGEVRVEEHRVKARGRDAVRRQATLLALEALERSLVLRR